MSNLLLSTLIPLVVVWLGAAVTAYRQPSDRLRSLMQHLAAGVVFAAAAVEILPDVLHSSAPLGITMLGASLGVAAMLGLQMLERARPGPLGLTVTAGVDVFIDGFVLGLAFFQGSRQGLMLTVALSLELVFLCVSVAAALGAAGPRRVLATTFGISLALPAGAVAGHLLGGLSTSWLTAFYAFGLMALLYLVTEELLTEAHETEDTPWMPLAFFVGFLGLVALEKVL